MIAVMGYTDAQERSKGDTVRMSVMIAVMGYTEDRERSKGTQEGSGAWEEATGSRQCWKDRPVITQTMMAASK